MTKEKESSLIEEVQALIKKGHTPRSAYQAYQLAKKHSKAEPEKLVIKKEKRRGK